MSDREKTNTGKRRYSKSGSSLGRLVSKSYSNKPLLNIGVMFELDPQFLFLAVALGRLLNIFMSQFTYGKKKGIIVAVKWDQSCACCLVVI